MIPWPDFTAVPTAVIRADLSPLALRLLLALAKHANESRIAWPKHTALLKLLPLGTSESALIRAKRELVDKGWLDYKPSTKGLPGHHPSEYTLMMPAAEGDLAISSPDETVTPDLTKPSGVTLRNGQVEKGTDHKNSPEELTTPPIVPQQKRNLRVVRFEYPHDFEAFWKALPERAQVCGKKSALSSWTKSMKNGATAEAIMAGLELWKGSEQWAKGYVNHATTWLNQERWKAKPEPARPPLNTGRPKITPDNFKGVAGEITL